MPSRTGCPPGLDEKHDELRNPKCIIARFDTLTHSCIMPLLAKLVCNRLGWTIPSGMDAKSGNAEFGPFESRFHFGFEEWLFNENHSIEKDGQTCHFGFVECFRNNRMLQLADSLHLFTELFPNLGNPNQVQTKRYVGYLVDVRSIDEATYDHILQTHPGIVQRMRAELSAALANDPVAVAALAAFDTAAEEQMLFNCHFVHGKRYNPPAEGRNWDYLVIRHGLQQYLPNHFADTNIGPDTIQELHNHQNVPQIL